MKSRWLVTLLVFVIGGAALGGVYLRLQENEESDADGEDSAVVDSARAAAQSTAASSAFATNVAVPVEAAPVYYGTFVLWVNAEGQAAALREASLAAEVGGPVVSVAVREGQYVRSGDLLAQIDRGPYELEVLQKQGELEQAEAEFQDLTLGDDKIEDPALRETRQTQARVRSGLAGAQARLDQAQYDLQKTEIRAPFSGRVANLVIVEGTRLSVNDSIAKIVDLSSLEVDVSVLESELAVLDTGREATVRFTAFAEEEFTGEVVTINPVVDPATHVGRVTIRLRNPGARILPGMHASVRIAGRLFENRFSVPKEAIVERSRREVVFVFEPESEGSRKGRAKWRYVTTALENAESVEIVAAEDTDMVAEGELVLTGGHTTLTHDALVEVPAALIEGDGT